MRSRLHEMCEFLDMDGADYRELPTNGGVDDLYKLWKSQPRRKLPSRARGPRAPRRAPAPRRQGRPQVAGGTGGIVESMIADC